VGDLLGATRAALRVPEATVLCLCGRNDKLRARVAKRLGDEPRLRLMGFTDRMGDVLAASDALIHSSAGLTVLEAIIRGCPVISYGFGYGWPRWPARKRTWPPRWSGRWPSVRSPIRHLPVAPRRPR
jgi:glycosyltransferase involved in cell wall biosynthesis